MLKALLTLGLVNSAWSETINFSLADDPASLNAYYSDTQKGFGVNVQLNRRSSLNFGLDSRDFFTRDLFYRLRFSLDSGLIGPLNYRGSLGAGYLDSKNKDLESKSAHSGFDVNRSLIGARQLLYLKFGENSGHYAEIGAGVSSVNDDNRGLESYFQSRVFGWLTDATASIKLFDRERYFFTDQKSRIGFLTGPRIPLPGLTLRPFGGMEVRGFNQELEEKTNNFGALLSFGERWQFRIAGAQNSVSQTKDWSGSVAYTGSWVSGEIFGLERTGAVWQKEKNIGLKVTIISIGSSSKNPIDKENFTANDYREPARQSQFYNETGYPDDRNLTLTEQAQRLKTLPLRSQWSRANLAYKAYGWWAIDPFSDARSPLETYLSRDGDCNDQSLLTSWIDQRNGYRAYDLEYRFGLGVSHGVELVQDPRTGRWFLDEYGKIQEVLVPAGADLRTVAGEALKQGAEFLAQPPTDPVVIYQVFQPNGDPALDPPAHYRDLVYEYRLFQSSAGRHPRRETGYELFAGPDALWK